MKIIELFKRFFSKEEINDIISVKDIIQIPGREYFNNNIDKLNLIDKYKAEYLFLLSQKRRISIKELSCDSLIKNNKKYIDLLLNIVMRDNYYDIEKQSIFEYKIKVHKLHIYLDEIVKIENETIERLIALSEISNSGIINKNNSDILISEIDSLKITLQIIISQKTSIINEIDSYLTHIIITNDENNLEEDFERRKLELIDDFNLFIKMDSLYKKSDLGYVKSKKKIDKQTAIMAVLETKLEEYIYNNSEIINELKSIIEDINSTNSLSILGSDTYHSIYSIQNQYLVFYKYGRNLINKDDLVNLYNAKFLEITKGVLDKGKFDGSYTLSLFRNVRGLEKEVYDNIISSKKEKILMGKNTVLNELFGSKSNIVIKMLYNHFNTYGTSDRKQKNYNHYEYLDTIRLILAFDSFDNFNKLIHKNSIQRPHTVKLFNEIKSMYNNSLLSEYVKDITKIDVKSLSLRL